MIPLRSGELPEENIFPHAPTSIKVINGQNVYLRGGLPVTDTVIVVPGGRRVLWTRFGCVRTL